jgi:hypothetical protein
MTINAAFQLELHLQQTLPLLCPEPYKHLKTTKLNPRHTFEETKLLKKKNNDYYVFLPSMNHFRFMEIQYIYQLLCLICFSGLSILILTSHDIFNHRAYVKRVDEIISCKFSFFSIHVVAFQGTFPLFIPP